jgi:sporulation protein YlmC with PRC-barrel domain
MELTKNELIGKDVINEKGILIGIIKKSLLDTNSGELSSILIEPSKEIDIENFQKNENGKIVLPCECISKVQDVIIFEN